MKNKILLISHNVNYLVNLTPLNLSNNFGVSFGYCSYIAASAVERALFRIIAY